MKSETPSSAQSSWSWNGALLIVSLVVRWAVSLNPYSGYKKPPMFGDFEAQRHWMEITVNLPLPAWYANSSDNDLLYWGLDYPPLTAYHSLVNGVVAGFINSSWNVLHASRGLEDPSHKLFMRSTVMFVDLLLYLPVVLLFYARFRPRVPWKTTEPYAEYLPAALALLNPGLVLVDHGHFQYNCFSLGLTLWAIFAVFVDRPFVASMLFCFSLNYKQMELYHALPFFLYLLKLCSRQPDFLRKVSMLIKLSLVVLVTFAACWAPFLLKTDLKGLLGILCRVFPFDRGIFEDKVANVWCSLQPLLRLRDVADQAPVVRLCLVTTLASIVPDSFLIWRLPSRLNLVRILVSVSLSFFLFSYHVHEKSILLATAPASLLFLHHPLLCGWFLTIATGSMFPLLHKDGLLFSSISLSVLFLVLFHAMMRDRKSPSDVPLVKSLSVPRTTVSLTMTASTIGMTVLCGLHLGRTPPERYPDLFPYLIAVYSCGHFLIFKAAFLLLAYEDAGEEEEVEVEARCKKSD